MKEVHGWTMRQILEHGELILLKDIKTSWLVLLSKIKYLKGHDCHKYMGSKEGKQMQTGEKIKTCKLLKNVTMTSRSKAEFI